MKNGDILLVKDKLFDLYITQKQPCRVVAKKFKISISTVTRWLKRYNIKTRTISQANTGNPKVSHKKESNGNYKDGRSFRKHYCKDCQIQISRFAKRCKACANIKSQKKRLKNRRSYKGVNCPNYKHGETLKQHFCIECNAIITYGAWYYGTKLCKSCSHRGKRNHKYIHGNGNRPYPLIFSFKLKTQIRFRDKFVCQHCDSHACHVHHIDYNKNNCSPANLITLCNLCNIKANCNIDYWYAYYTYLMEKIYASG